jgi:hypothetical protein
MKYYKRGFLNPEEGMAAFEAEICRGEYQEKDGAFDAFFSITDCNRKVTLDFAVWSKEDVAKSYHKINTLITELEVFREQLTQFGAGVKEKEEIPEDQ